MQRAWGRSLVVTLFAGLLLASSVEAKSFPRLDLGFGSGGYVALPPQLPGPTNEEIRFDDFAATPDGAVYATESSPRTCVDEVCKSIGYLARVNSDGSIATTFGGGGRVQVGGIVQRLSPPLSDAEGRVLVASQEGSNVTVHRYLADGAPDTSFGTAGSTTFDCGCGASGYRNLLLAIDHRERIVVSINTATLATIRAAALSYETMARLLPSGAMDESFGGGVVQLGEAAPPMDIAFAADDTIYTVTADCCQVWSLLFLSRISASGVLDSRFKARSDRALVDVATRGVGSGVVGWSQLGLIIRPSGWLDIYGGGWLIRMRQDGYAERKFGQGGIRDLRWNVLSPLSVGHGKVLALGSATFGGVRLIRLNSNGSLDRSFGRGGTLSIKGVSAENAEKRLSLARLQGARVQVLDKGDPRCRSCRPKLVRYRMRPQG